MDNPLRPVVTAWLSKLQRAMKYKKEKFQDDADEAMFFYDGPYEDMYGDKRGAYSKSFSVGNDVTRPGFSMTVNKCAEMVEIFGPALYHRNPVRQVSPRRMPMLPIELFGIPEDPMVQMAYGQLGQQVGQLRAVDKARAVLLESYLNWTPTALDLKSHSRWAIDEALIKGMGTLWTEIYNPPGSPQQKIIGSFYESVDFLGIDPDGESLANAKWIARLCAHPVWEVEQTYGLERGTFKGNVESFARQAEIKVNPQGEYRRKQGLTNDLMYYWKIYSKMGMGGRLSGALPGDAQVDALRDVLDRYGNFCYLVVSNEVPWPLNLPPQVIETASDAEIAKRIEWPTPFWADDAWPFSPVVFHWKPREVWPISHLKPGMGELKFLNWAYSMLAGKVRVACRDFLAYAKSTSEELKEKIRHGGDYTEVEVEALHGDIDKVIKFLQHPSFQADIYKVIQGVEANFEKRVGLTELVYGLTQTQMRSAAEAETKANQISVRPDDMANKVEDAMTEVARHEALAARWHLQPQDVQPMLGPLGAQWWMQYVQPSDIGEILHQLEYRIEAGSARKPNRDREANNMQEAMKALFQPLWAYGQGTGDWKPVNKLIADWAKSLDLDPAGYLINPPPPPMMPGMPGMPGMLTGGPGGMPPSGQQGTGQFVPTQPMGGMMPPPSPGMAGMPPAVLPGMGMPGMPGMPPMVPMGAGGGY